MTECLLPILQYEDSSSEGEFEAAAEGSDDDDDDERMYGEEEEGEGDVGLDEEVLGSNTAADLATVYCLLCTGCCVLATGLGYRLQEVGALWVGGYCWDVASVFGTRAHMRL